MNARSLRRRLGILVTLASPMAGFLAPSCGGSTAEAPGADASVASDVGVDASAARPKTTLECFGDLAGPVPGPNYEQFNPKMGTHCAGTQAQRIEGVEQLVFMGDSITVGTPPTPRREYYSTRVEAAVKAKFGEIPVRSCARWGARTDDFIRNGDAAHDGGQIGQCFPTGVEEKKTLIVMTMGGNDVNAWIEDNLDGEAAKRAATEAAQLHGDALAWLKSPAHFPNGSYVILANVYDFTDTTSDISSCPTAVFGGRGGVYAPGPAVLKHFIEELMRHTVATGSDMIFMLENFCGHGFRRSDPELQCYRGPNADLWFDFTCIHPNPDGHERIAEMFMTVIEGG